MAEAKEVLRPRRGSAKGHPNGDDYSRETAEADCAAAIGRASNRHRVAFGPLRWSVLDVGDSRVPPASTGALPGVKLLRVEPIADWHLHDLRRTCATGLGSLGIDRLTASKVLNHAEGGVTRVYDRYAADPEKRQALEAWAQHVEAVVSDKPALSNVVEIRKGA